MSQEAGVCSRPREERLKGCPEAGQNKFFALNEALDQAEVRRIANGVTDFLKSGGFPTRSKIKRLRPSSVTGWSAG